jgi:hypothetical protein
LPHLHIFLDSPASNELTKTELDIGIITKPYVEIAHCIRAGFCISHALREWVRITLGFAYTEPYSLTLDPTTLRYLGTDERSILHIILRSQESHKQVSTKVPYGVSLSEGAIREKLANTLTPDILLLMPNKRSTWKEKVAECTKIAMYCPLFETWDKDLQSPQMALYSDRFPRDVAILEIAHVLDTF